MPTYQYVCTECGGQIEAVQKFTDDPLTVHDDCGGKLRKVFSPVGIVFKGSGFYRTDSRSGSSSSTVASDSSSSGSPDSSSSDSAGSSSASNGSSAESKGSSPEPKSASPTESKPAAKQTSSSSSGAKVA